MAAHGGDSGKAVRFHQIRYVIHCISDCLHVAVSTVVISSHCNPFYPHTDRIIQRKRRDYLDPNSSSNMKKLNDDLQSIHSIMRKTIDDVLDR